MKMDKIQNMSVNKSGIKIDGKSINTVITKENVRIKNLCVNPPKEDNFMKEFKVPRINEPFKGRDQELKELYSLFFIQNIRKVLIAGNPGYGKTELSKQFAYWCKKEKLVEEIVWVKTEGKQNNNQLEELSRNLMSIYEEYKERKVLFIFDNVENEKHIMTLEPPNEKNYLLITSREKNWDRDVHLFEIQKLTVESCTEIFTEILKEINKPMYEELAGVLNNVPHAIQMAAGLIRQQKRRRGLHFQFKKYVDGLKKSKPKFLNLKTCIPNDYEYTL